MVTYCSIFSVCESSCSLTLSCIWSPLGSEVVTMIHTVVFGTHSIEINSTDCIMKCKLEGSSIARFRDKLQCQLCLGAEASWVVELPYSIPAGEFLLSSPPSSYARPHGLRQLVNTMAETQFILTLFSGRLHKEPHGSFCHFVFSPEESQSSPLK